MFGSWSRPECVEELHQQAQLNLQSLLQGKDGDAEGMTGGCVETMKGGKKGVCVCLRVCVCVRLSAVFRVGGIGTEAGAVWKVFTCVALDCADMGV